MAKRPKPEDIASWCADAYRRSEEQRRIDKRQNDVYFNRHHVEIPAGENLQKVERKTGLAVDTVTRIDSLLDSKPPIVNIEYGTMNQDDQRIAGEQEDWASTIWDRLNEGYSPWRATRQDMIRLGRGVSLIEFTPDAWSDWPEREDGESDEDYMLRVMEFNQEAGIPISWRHVPAMEFVPVLSGPNQQLTAGYWFGTRYAKDVIDTYGRKVPNLVRKLNDKDITPHTLVRFTQYSDANWTAYVVGDEVTGNYDTSNLVPALDVPNVFPNPLGLNPFVFMPGIQTSDPQAELQFLSVLYFITPQIEQLDSLRSARATSIFNYSFFPPMIQKLSSLGVPTGDVEERKPIPWKLGGSIALFDNETIEWPKHPGISADVDSEIALIMDEINRLGMAPMEMADPRVTGYARNLSLQIASSKFGGYIGSMSLAVRQIVERWLAIAKYILTDESAPKGLALYADPYEAKYGHLALQKKHFQRSFRVKVTIPSPIKPDFLATIQAITALRGGPDPILPDELLWTELLGYTDTQKIKDLLTLQKIQRDPVIQKVAQAEIMRRLNMKLDSEDVNSALAGPVPGVDQVPFALQAALAQRQAPTGGPLPMIQQGGIPPVQAQGAPVVTGRAPGQEQAQLGAQKLTGMPL